MKRIEAGKKHEANAQTYAIHVLGEAERRAEGVLAWLRVAALLTLVIGLRVFEYAENDHVLLVSLVGYGAATAAAVVLAWRHFYHPIAAWIMATLDVAIVLHFILVDAIHHAPQPAELLSHPAPAMIFLLLAFSAIRYRPALVAYSFGLFFAGAVAIAFGFERPSTLWPPAVPIEGAGWFAIMALTAVALWIASARARRLLLRSFRETRLREMLARYVAAPVMKELERTVAQEREIAILFVDIRGFTAFSEGRSPEEIVSFLETYRALTERVITRHLGGVDKFIGDAVLAVFDRLDPAESAAACIASSLELLEELESWNEARLLEGEAAVEVGMGAHLGRALVGTVGREGRLEYTVIGDAVNTAQRIERMSARHRKPLFISAPLLTAAGPRWKRYFVFLGMRHLRGRREPVHLLELKANNISTRVRLVHGGQLALAGVVLLTLASQAAADDANLSRALSQAGCTPAKITLLSQTRDVEEYRVVCRGAPAREIQVICARRECVASRGNTDAPSSGSPEDR